MNASLFPLLLSLIAFYPYIGILLLYIIGKLFSRIKMIFTHTGAIWSCFHSQSTSYSGVTSPSPQKPDIGPWLEPLGLTTWAACLCLCACDFLPVRLVRQPCVALSCEYSHVLKCLINISMFLYLSTLFFNHFGAWLGWLLIPCTW